MSTPHIHERVVDVWDGRIRLRTRVAGAGPPLVYLHSAAGLMWDPFLTRLCDSYTVYAPEFPGTSPADPYAIHQLDDLWDVILAYEQALRELGLGAAALIGHSFGGMLAAELAAAYPGRFTRLALIAPLGLWRDDTPVSNWMTVPSGQLSALFFAHPDSEAARAMFAIPDDQEAAISAGVGLIWALGCTGKFLWPLPEKGLAKRLHRVSAPTLIIWGEHDHLIPSGYASEFAQRIPGSRVVLIPEAGHTPQLEHLDATYAAVASFLR